MVGARNVNPKTGGLLMSDQLTDQDAAAIRTVFDRAARLLEAGDFPAWSELWAEDAVLMPPNYPSV